MNICFLADPWEQMNPMTESTLRLIQAASKRLHQVCLCKPGNLTIRENVTYAYCRTLQTNEYLSDSIVTLYGPAVFKQQTPPLNGFDAAFIHKHLPLDNDMLNFLDSIKNVAFIVNDVDGLRKASNEIYVTSFEGVHEIIPETSIRLLLEFYIGEDMNYVILQKYFEG